MDASVNHNSWFLRMGEQALRVFAMGLVLTGQMLPAGAVSAQDDPPSPSFSTPPAKPISGLTPVAVESPRGEEEATAPQEVEENTAAPHPGEAAEETLPSATDPEETPAAEEMPAADETPAAEEAPVEVPLTEEAPAAEPTPAADEAPAPAPAPEEPAAADESAAEAAPVPNATSEEAPSVEDVVPAASIDSTDPSKYQIGEWTMTILPGPVPPRATQEYRTPVAYEGSPMNQNTLSVPVNVTVDNSGSQGWPWPSPWSTPWSYVNYRNSPTAAYLFQHPQPYWQLRQDFYHLRPFIRGL